MRDCRQALIRPKDCLTEYMQASVAKGEGLRLWAWAVIVMVCQVEMYQAC
jgi:hypothetical protein